MSLIPSLLLYNPLESALLLWCVWLLRDKQYRELKFNKRKFVIDSYILGTIFLFIQYPMNNMGGLLFIIYNNIVVISIMIFLITKYFNKCNIIKVAFVLIIYTILQNAIVKHLGFPFALSNSLIFELKANLYIKGMQFIIILGVILMKKFLVSLARRNVSKMIASTINGYGEPNLSSRLQEEIKK